MYRRLAQYVFVTACVFGTRFLPAQQAPAGPSHVWHGAEERNIARELATIPHPTWTANQEHIYPLTELIDLAELHNPDTRAAWERAKTRAAEIGIAASAYFPTLTAVVYAASLRQPALGDEYFHRQTIALYSPTLNVDYLIFDLGGRSGAVEVAKANFIIAGLAFNDTHRRLIYDVSAAYFSVLNAEGHRQAAEMNLKNAKAVEAEAGDRLDHGLATKPDLLEAGAARAQADFELQAAVGANVIALGRLATLIGLPAETQLKLQRLNDLPIPDALTDSLDNEIAKALQQRPELLEAVGRMRAAQGSLKKAESAYFPTLSFSGSGGLARGYGQDDLNPGHYAAGEVWNAGLSLRWTLFDGARREEKIAAAKSQRRTAEAELQALRDQIDDEVFTSYTNMQTALRQRQAAAAFLSASTLSYDAAREAYRYGLRSELDVIAAQKTLAQALYEDVSARSQLLLQSADLAFRTADMIQVQPSQAKP